MDLFTKNKDVDREILLKIKSDRQLLDTCSVDKYALSLCNESFFRNRLQRKYPETLQDKPEEMKWKEYYLKMVYYVGKLSEKYNFPFVKGNPEKYYKIFQEPKNYLQLYEASKNNYFDLIKFFIKKDKDYTSSDIAEWGISGAAEYDHLDLVKYFLAATKQFPEYNKVFLDIALGAASGTNRKSLIDYLLNEGADPNEGLYSSAKNNQRDIIEYLISKGANKWNSGLYGSLRVSNNELAKYFISLGADGWKLGLKISKEEDNKEMIEYFSQKLNID